jgi:hypothetical protein
VRSARGQASIEWIAAVLLVAALLAAAAAGALPAADALPRAVGAAFARAFCLVSGGDCLSGAPRPCVVRSGERARERRGTLVVARLADGRRVLREERSDGTVAVTVEDAVRGGAGVSFGVKLGRGKASAELVADVRGASGRRFVLPDRAAADRLIARLAGERGGARGIVEGHDGGPVPDERWRVVGQGGEAEAALRFLELGPKARAVTGSLAGVRERPRTGERVLVLRNDTELVAALIAPLVGFTTSSLGGLRMELPSSAAVELAFDPDGRPASLTVRGARGIGGEVRVGGLRAGGGDLVEAELRLDLGDPAAGELVGELLDAVADVAPGRVAGAARALGERMAERARVDVRVYETDRRATTTGIGLGVLGGIGYEVEEVERTARLVDAVGREPGLGWARRLDCLGIA